MGISYYKAYRGGKKATRGKDEVKGRGDSLEVDRIQCGNRRYSRAH